MEINNDVSYLLISTFISRSIYSFTYLLIFFPILFPLYLFLSSIHPFSVPLIHNGVVGGGLEPIPAFNGPLYPGCTSQGHTETSNHTHSHSLLGAIWSVQLTRETPRRHRANMQTPHWKEPGSPGDSNREPSGCEATVTITTPPCRPIFLSYIHLNILYSSYFIFN